MIILYISRDKNNHHNNRYGFFFKNVSREPIPLQGNLSYIHEKLLPFLVRKENGKVYEICGVVFRAVEDYRAFPPRLLLIPIKGSWICTEI